jgi:LDH2 family malate/lactate/ureidoglycolate dehydrogenase
VDAFLPRDDYERSLEELAARIKSGPMRPGVTEILLPGEGGARRRQAGAARGVTVAREVWAEVVALARSLGVEHPVPAARPEA